MLYNLGALENEENGKWYQTCDIEGKTYVCSYCGNRVAPSYGYIKERDMGYSKIGSESILICPNCNKPTYLNGDEQYPNTIGGIGVKGIEDPKIKSIYEEARRCMVTDSYTACVLCCRKALMNIAVSNKADEGQNFVYYVNYLNDKGYIPPNGRQWVDKIRKLGNEATHEINIVCKEQAELALNFLGMLLKFIYELPLIFKNGEESFEDEI